MATLNRSLTTHPRLKEWQMQGLWVLGAAVIGFLTTALFSTWLQVPRAQFVGVYAVIVLAYGYLYARTNWLGLRDLAHRHIHWWLVGTATTAVIGAFLAFSMLRAPASPRPEGAGLLLALVWLGLLYGIVDALILTVLPVMAAWRALSGFRAEHVVLGTAVSGVGAFLASVFVTVAYHAGYGEYRGPEMVSPVIGNAIMTLGYIVTANPLVAVATHIILHVVSVLHGIDTTPTLPPHY